jgi:hypothetical protein
MHTSHFTHPTFVLTTTLSLLTASAQAGIIIDSFDASSQMAFAGGSTTSSSVNSGQSVSAVNAAIAPIANSQNNRVARASWSSFGDNSYSAADKGNRFSSTTIDTAAGTANFNFGGKLGEATGSLAYNAVTGTSMDFASQGHGIGITGSLVGSTGITNPSLQGLTLDLVLTDAYGVQANYTFFGYASGGFSGLNGGLLANFADFAPFNPDDSIDLTQVTSFSMNFAYQCNAFGAGIPEVAGSYQVGSISIVPAPGAVALLAAAGLVGMRRRR